MAGAGAVIVGSVLLIFGGVFFGNMNDQIAQGEGAIRDLESCKSLGGASCQSTGSMSIDDQIAHNKKFVEQRVGFRFGASIMMVVGLVSIGLGIARVVQTERVIAPQASRWPLSDVGGGREGKRFVSLQERFPETHSTVANPADAAVEHLRLRLARGEIDEQTYERQLRLIALPAGRHGEDPTRAEPGAGTIEPPLVMDDVEPIDAVECSCGAQLAHGSQFCQNCGRRVPLV